MLEQLLHCAKPCLTLRPPGQLPTRLLCPWDSPDKSTGVGCHFLLQWIFLTQGSNACLLYLLHWQEASLSLYHLGSRVGAITVAKQKLNEMGWCLGQGAGKPKQENNWRNIYTKGVVPRFILGAKEKYTVLSTLLSVRHQWMPRKTHHFRISEIQLQTRINT